MHGRTHGSGLLVSDIPARSEPRTSSDRHSVEDPGDPGLPTLYEKIGTEPAQEVWCGKSFGDPRHAPRPATVALARPPDGASQGTRRPTRRRTGLAVRVTGARRRTPFPHGAHPATSETARLTRPSTGVRCSDGVPGGRAEGLRQCCIALQCGCCSGELGKGWAAFRCDDPDEGQGPEIAIWCPVCAAAEFGYRPESRRGLRASLGTASRRHDRPPRIGGSEETQHRCRKPRADAPRRDATTPRTGAGSRPQRIP